MRDARSFATVCTCTKATPPFPPRQPGCHNNPHRQSTQKHNNDEHHQVRKAPNTLQAHTFPDTAPSSPIRHRTQPRLDSTRPNKRRK